MAEVYDGIVKGLQEVIEYQKGERDLRKSDWVEVVRCKDCVHYCKRHVLGDSIEDDAYYMACDMGLGAVDDDWSVYDRVLPDDFCSFGERRKNE